MSRFMVCNLVPSSESPEELYKAWADEIGVSNTETLMNLNTTGGVFKFSLASGCLYPESKTAEFCSDGMIGWSGVSKKNDPIFINFSRMYYYSNIQPDHLIAFRFDGYNCVSQNCKIQTGNGQTILTGRIAPYVSYNWFIDFSIRFNEKLDLPEIIIKIFGNTAKIFAANLFQDASRKIDSQYATEGTYWLKFSTAPAFFSNLNYSIGRGFICPGFEDNISYVHNAFPAALVRKNIYYSGTYKLSGTVKEKAVPNDKPVSTKVLLLDQKANVVVQEQWSDPVTGEYSFKYLDWNHEYKVESFDHTGRFGAVIADKQRPEPM